MKKSFIFCALVALMASCSKDEQPTVNQNSDYKIEISLSGDVSSFSENLTLTMITDEGKTVNLTGETWEDGQRTQTTPQTVTYSTFGTPKNRTLTTTDKVQSVVVTQMLLPNPTVQDKQVTSTVVIYTDGNVKTKKTYTFKGVEGEFLMVD